MPVFAIGPHSVQDRGAFDKQTETHVLGGALHDVLVQEEPLVMLLPIV